LRPVTDRARQTGKLLGDSDAVANRPVALSVADARHHLHVVGATGTGKSTLLTRLIVADAVAGRGVAVLDPKGDLINDVLERLPADAADRLVLLDPAETDSRPAWNVLDGAGRPPELVVDQLVGVFARLYAANWGPRTDDILRAACLTALRRPGATLTDIPQLLANRRVRAPLTAGLHDPAGLGGFWAWYDGLSDTAAAQVTGPALNKLRAVLTRPFAADLFGSAQSTFRMGDILNGGILLARLPKGLLGDDTTRLVGSLLLSGIWQAAAARSSIPEADRLDACVYVDECHNFLHLPGALDDVLAEARGYRLSLTLAHQHLGQLPRDLAEGIAANARNKIVFNVSPDDAHTLGRHFGPRLTDRDLSHLGGWQAAARLVVNGRNTTGFTLATRPPLPPVGAQSQLRAAARQHGHSSAARRAAALQRRHPTGSTPSSRPDTHSAVAGDGLGDALTDVLPDVFGDDLDTPPDPSPHPRSAAQHLGPVSTLGDDSDW
jgi:hypothetical protein